MMPEGDWLSALQMRIARHHCTGVLLRFGAEHKDQFLDLLRHRIALISQIQP